MLIALFWLAIQSPDNAGVPSLRQLEVAKELIEKASDSNQMIEVVDFFVNCESVYETQASLIADPDSETFAALNNIARGSETTALYIASMHTKTAKELVENTLSITKSHWGAMFELTPVDAMKRLLTEVQTCNDAGYFQKLIVTEAKKLIYNIE